MIGHYLDRFAFHNELAICKRKGELSPLSLKMFQKLAKEVSRDFYFNYDDDRKDAIATALHDLFKYWRNFKENNVVQVKFIRNFVEGDQITINIFGRDGIAFTAGEKADASNNVFEICQIISAKDDIKSIKKQIGKATNYSLQNFIKLVMEKSDNSVSIYHDKIKGKITFMDNLNGDTSIKSSIIIHSNSKCPLIDKDRDTKKDSGEFFLKEPPNAFSYFTSIVRNACMKSISKNKPKYHKKSNTVSIDSINRDGGGFFNL